MIYGPKYTIEDGPPESRKSKFNRYTVRLYDMFDGWIDIKQSLTWEEAVSLWSEKTDGGTRKTKYSDGDYYDIFPNETRMIHTPEFRGR